MNDAPNRSLIDKALQRARRAWRGQRSALAEKLSPDLPDDDAERVVRQMRDCLEGKGGEVAARARGADLGRAYLALGAEGRARFLTLLATALPIDMARIEAAVADLHEAEGEARIRAVHRLHLTTHSPSLELLTQFNGLPEGVKFLVDLRADLLQLAKRDPALRVLDDNLQNLLASWFDTGFLSLRRVTWDAPASLLEKLITYEAVHEIQSWDDLKDRLDSDRRLYAFFHPGMPDEPLIFIEVALTNGIVGNIQGLLDEEAPAADAEAADTALFYSISNAQEGLRGVSFGSFLIKRVVDDLARGLPNLKTFSTLSPIPGFSAWLTRQAEAGALPLGKADARAIPQLAATDGAPGPALLDILMRADWHRDDALAAALTPILMRLCATYLLSTAEDGRALDRVAHFHLSNGAVVHRINWLADVSEIGLRQSAGLMVNYRYKLEDIEANHETYRGDGQVVATSAVRNLAKGAL